MYPLLETIRLENGRIQNLEYHEKRVDYSLDRLFGKRNIPPLKEIIGLKASQLRGIYKCRLLYSSDEYSIETELYRKRTIEWLLIVEEPDIKYSLKYADRSVFEKLYDNDDHNSEIIITQNGILTDTRYTNIALMKDGVWHTPKTPLLEGTQRALLLDNGIIQPKEIHIDSLSEYSKIRLFNAMMLWNDCIELDLSKIKLDD